MLIFKKIEKKKLVIYSFLFLVMILGTVFFIYKNYNSGVAKGNRGSAEMINNKNMKEINLEEFKNNQSILDGNKFTELKKNIKKDVEVEVGRQDPFSSF